MYYSCVPQLTCTYHAAWTFNVQLISSRCSCNSMEWLEHQKKKYTYCRISLMNEDYCLGIDVFFLKIAATDFRIKMSTPHCLHILKERQTVMFLKSGRRVH